MVQETARRLSKFGLVNLGDTKIGSIQPVAGGPEILAALTPEGSPYLLATHAEQHEPQALSAALMANNTAGVAIFFRDADDGYDVFRKNFRTGDITTVAAVDAVRQAQPGFEFRPAKVAGDERTLEPLTSRLENVLFEVHSVMRDVDGLHAPDALDEICKVIFAKIFDEEQAKDSGRHFFQRALYSSIEECAAAVRHLYLKAVGTADESSSQTTSNFELSLGAFREPIKLSSQAINRTVTLLEGYTISGSPVDIKGRAFQKVISASTRSGMGQYFTPKPVISLCVQLLSPKARDVVIDPFCGSGHFLIEALDFVKAHGDHTSAQFHDFALGRLHGIEKSERMVRVAMTDMWLHGEGRSRIRYDDALLPLNHYSDFDGESFDVVLTNPPFGVDLPKEALAGLGPFEILNDRRGDPNSISLEIVAIDRCLELLRPGGRMAIVLPDGILSNRGTDYVRAWIRSKALLKAVVSLPIETFTPFGANIKTSILVLRKAKAGEKMPDKYNVFFADIASIGHDASGREIDCDDLGALAAEFTKFVAEEGW